MRTIAYIDGFNLYYGCLRHSSYKWLDLKELCQSLLPENQITAIKYFTAKIKAKSLNDQAPRRQQTYMKALKAYIPEITIHYGYFLQREKEMTNANPPPNKVRVLKTEEKGSDVNLAVHMLNDAWRDMYDCAVVVSNDGDIAGSMRLIREYHQDKRLVFINPGHGFINPGRGRTSNHLERYAHFVKAIRSRNLLKSCQLPHTIPGTSIHKPESW